MAWETPDAYFPSTLKVKFGFEMSRKWNTLVTPTPSGTRQARALWIQPKRRATATILAVDRVAFQAIDDFLYTRMGNLKPYYVFNWYHKDFTKEPRPGLAAPATLTGGTPLTLPFLGGTITKIYVNGSLAYGPGNFTTDNGGAGGEKRILTVTGGAGILINDLVQVEISDTRERIPVVSLTDTDDFRFDWRAAVPPIETGLQVEEVF